MICEEENEFAIRAPRCWDDRKDADSLPHLSRRWLTMAIPISLRLRVVGHVFGKTARLRGYIPCISWCIFFSAESLYWSAIARWTGTPLFPTGLLVASPQSHTVRSRGSPKSRKKKMARAFICRETNTRPLDMRLTKRVGSSERKKKDKGCAPNAEVTSGGAITSLWHPSGFYLASSRRVRMNAHAHTRTLDRTSVIHVHSFKSWYLKIKYLLMHCQICSLNDCARIVLHVFHIGFESNR